MSSLATCIKKLGKVLSKTDVSAIREIRDELTSGGMAAAEANTKAIDEYLETLAGKRGELVLQIQKAGGRTEKEEITSSKLAQQDMFGADLTAQQLADETAKRDAKRNTGQEEIETGEETDLFSEARKEQDLRFKIEDDFVEQMVEKHPDHPTSQLSKLGAVVEDISERAATDVSTIRKIWESTKDISREAFLISLPQSKLPEVVRNAMPGIGHYVRTMKRMDGFINERLEALAETGNTWRTLIRKNGKDARSMGKIMHWATKEEVDPSKPFKLPKSFATMKKKQKRKWMLRKRQHAILKKEWDALSSEAQGVYKKVQKDYANMREETMDALENRIQAAEADEMVKAQLIAELRKEFEAGKIEPYFPLARFGKNWATVKDEVGKIVAFVKEENRAVRDEFAKQMRAEGFDVLSSQQKNSDFKNVERIDPNFVARITELTKGMVAEEGNVSIADEIWQLYLRSLPEMSARKRDIHRVGRLGWTGDALRAYGHHMFHGTHQLGKLNFGFQLENHLDGIDKQAHELTERADRIKNDLKNTSPAEVHETLLSFPHYKKLFGEYKGTETERIDKAIAKFIKQAEMDGPWAQPLADSMKQRHKYNMNPDSSLWATRLTGFGFFWFLSTSPAAGVLNLTQTAIVGLPVLTARFKKGSAAAELLKGSYQLGRTHGDLKNALRGDERKAFEEFDRIGMFSKTRVRDLTGYAERGEDFTGKGQLALDVTSWIFHHTEKWNREITGLAAYRLARKNGRTHEQGILEAEELVEMSHFDYTNTNRPQFMQNDVARVALLFRNFSLNMTYRLARDFRDGILRNQSVDVEVRNEAAKRLTGVLGMAFLFAGTTGMPLMWAFHGVLDAALGDDDEPYDSQAAFRAHLTELYGEDVATFVTHGAWDTLTDATLSTRASLNNLWFREIPDRLEGKSLGQHIITEAAGPLGGILVNAAEGIFNIGEGHVGRGIEKLLPKFASDALKAIRYATEGALTYDRDVIMTPEEFTNWNLAMQFFGFIPVPLTTRYEQGRAVKDMQQAITGRKNYLMDRLFRAAKMGDTKELKHIYKLIAKFDRANPNDPITTRSIIRAAKIRTDNDARAMDGTTVPVKYHYLHERFRMTDKDKEE